MNLIKKTYIEKMKKQASFFIIDRHKYWAIFFVCMNLTAITLAREPVFKYRRSLDGIENQWHTMWLPEDLYQHAQPELADLRIFGITSDHDTIEAPYLIREQRGGSNFSYVKFKILNQTHKNNHYFYTFKVPEDNIINHMVLKFDNPNYDLTVYIEGSNDQKEWFEFSDNYRILSIHDGQIDYEHNEIYFKPARYNYFRINFKTDIKPGKLTATLAKMSIDSGRYYTYEPSGLKLSYDKTSKNSVLEVDLPGYVPVSYIDPIVKVNTDYYRRYVLECATDSFLTQNKQWKYYFKTVSTGTISSLGSNTIRFENQITKHIKMTIFNYDNPPLSIPDVIVKGNANELIVRFDTVARYFLYYGNPQLPPPYYDINVFEHHIPKNLIPIKPSKEEILDRNNVIMHEPKTRIGFLWMAIGVIILMLGGFTIHMMKSYQKN
jgi:hypothetical protein